EPAVLGHVHLPRYRALQVLERGCQPVWEGVCHRDELDGSALCGQRVDRRSSASTSASYERHLNHVAASYVYFGKAKSAKHGRGRQAACGLKKLSSSRKVRDLCAHR